MKTKQKQAAHGAFALWAKQLSKYQFILVTFSVVVLTFAGNVLASSSSIMINEIQVSGGTGKTTQEFIELYNATDKEISLKGFSLKKKTKTQSTEPTILLSPVDFNGVIPSHGYFLMAHPDYSNIISADNSFSPDISGNLPSLASDNTIFLFDDNNNLLDKVGYGNAQDNEISSAPNVPDKKSIERKNLQDTGNNGADFHILAIPTPLNSSYREEADDTADVVLCHGDPSGVVLNEIYPSTQDEKKEFVEIVNTGEECVDISGWSVKDSTTISSHKTIFSENNILDPDEYFYIEKNLYLNNDEDTVFLLNKAGSEIDKRKYENASTGHSYSLIGAEWLWTFSPTKGEENIYEEKPIDDIVVEPVPDAVTGNKTYSDKIRITELFPNPFKSQYEEYIELYNGSSESIDLMGWILHDATKSGKYLFPQSVILKTKEYLAVFKKDFKFALNNSGDESVTLQNPDGEIVSKIEYKGSKRNLSYSFDGERWRWSKFLTPGKENVLNNEPYGKLKIDDDIYKKVYADFSVSTGDVDGDKVRVTWDFGDGHKSYLAKTRHKYEKEGKYEGSVKLSDGSEDVIKNFAVEVEKYPHPKVRIIAINANPEGSDSALETLTIENKSKKKINLEGWSIATGSKKLSNHPITERLNISKKAVKEITREFSKFSLNNKKGKIELRYPDGEVADKVKYDHGKVSIDEDEIYLKSDGKWVWIPSNKSIKSVKFIRQEETVDTSSATSNQPASSAGGSLDANVSSAEKVAGADTVKREYSFVMLESSKVIGKMEFKNSDSRVLGAETVREIDGQYFLTPIAKEKQHYAIVFLKNISSIINTKLNLISNLF